MTLLLQADDHRIARDGRAWGWTRVARDSSVWIERFACARIAEG